MNKYIVELSKDICEITISKIDIPAGKNASQYLKSLASDWMSHDSEPRWFERDDICHCNGAIFDSKLKVSIFDGNKKIDNFKAIDLRDKFPVINAYKMLTEPPTHGSIMGMSISNGVQSFAIEMESYNRNLLQFKLDKISFSVGFLHCEAYIVAELSHATMLGIDSTGILERTFYEYLPTSSVPTLEFDRKFSNAFRHELL
jgi:hypothetical protein